MSIRTCMFALALGMAVTSAGYAQAQSATLWSFMGIPQGYNKIHGALFNRHGLLPGLERKPPLKAIADPANLASENPALKKAAEVKAQEDLAPQKIKAVRYLTRIGCGCYNKDGSITEALVKSLDDCTEEVRLATVRAIARAAESERCENCSQRNCCSEEITEKLAELAYEYDETGCPLEPSERVRRAAAEALRVCCPGYQYEEVYSDPNGEVIPDPDGETVPDVPQPTPVDPVPPDVETRRIPRNNQTQLASSRRTAPNSFDAATQRQLDSVFTSPSQQRASAETAITLLIDRAGGRAMVQLPDESQLPVGSRLTVYQNQRGQLNPLGYMVVYQSRPGAAVIRPVGGLQLGAIGPGVVVVRE